MSMAASIENVPFLDNGCRARHGLASALSAARQGSPVSLRRAVTGLLPRYIRRTPGRGLQLPCAQWLSEPQQRCLDLCRSKRFYERGIHPAPVLETELLADAGNLDETRAETLWILSLARIPKILRVEEPEPVIGCWSRGNRDLRNARQSCVARPPGTERPCCTVSSIIAMGPHRRGLHTMRLGMR
jgi:hypothetical protein